MSSRRSSSSSSRSGSMSTEDEIIISDLLLKLETLVPSSTSNTGRRRRSSSAYQSTLRETCNYIKSLHKQVDDLSEKLSEILASMDDDDASTITLDQVEILRALLFPQHQ